MSRFKFLWCGLPCRKRPQTSEIQEDQSITNVTDQNPPQIQIASLEGPRLATHTPAISDPLSVYSWYSAHSRIQKRPYERLPLDVELEEETNPGYRAETWYHVRIGEIVRDRYLICTKLGWGDTSTVWLANDLRNTRYVAIKVCANPHDQRVRELDFIIHITRLYSNHPGAQNVTTLLDHFHIRRKGYTYLCLVTDVLGPNLEKQVPKTLRRLDIDWLKEQLYRILQAVDFLHTVAYIVHGDIWPPNVLCAIPDRRALQELDELESQEPSDRKIDGDRVLYVSRAVKFRPSCMPVLIDFGNSRLSTAADGVESMRELRESVNVRKDEPYRPQRDFEWVGGMFIGMVEGRTLFRVVLSLPVNQPSHAIEVAVPEEEKQQLLRFLWKMKNSNGNTSGSAASTISTHRGSIGEVTAEELLRDTVFRDPEHRYHHTW